MSAPVGRVAISLTTSERTALKQLAHRRNEPEATTAARFVRAGLLDDGAALDRPPTRRRGPETSTVATHAALDHETAIALLTERYSLDLAGSRQALASDRLATERLTALARWRDHLDADASPDPRHELGFHAELIAVSRWLEERSRRRR